jgi:hypothetical protein
MTRRKQSQSACLLYLSLNEALTLQLGSRFLRYDRTALSLRTAARPILFPLLKGSMFNPHPDRSVGTLTRWFRFLIAAHNVSYRP